MTNPVLVEVTRGQLVESIHRGSIAVSDARGKLVVEIGDVSQPLFPRSALKPVQAVPLIESGAADAFHLSDEEIALACASHSAEPMHTTRILAWLDRIGCKVGDFACGPQRPGNDAVGTQMIRDGVRWTELHNNCSGKHTGFMTLARHLGAPVSGYELHDHPVQRHVESTLREMGGLSGALPWGIDGCTVPNFAVPLSALARAMAQFANPSGLTATRAAACKRIVRAMTAHPDLVAGTGRACTALMRESPSVAVKTGAEGVYVAMIPSLGFGAAVKIDDGTGRAAEAVIAGLMIALGAAPEGGAASSIANAPVPNTRGVTVGQRRIAKDVLRYPGGSSCTASLSPLAFCPLGVSV